MSEIINKFEVFSKISENLRTNIKLFHVFFVENGLNVLFITRDDKVYGFGRNTWGCCGLGHRMDTRQPQEIPELSHQSIKQFLVGGDFMLAINEVNHVFGWGQNGSGILDTGSARRVENHFKPYLIDFPYDEHMVEISCGSHHLLALTSYGHVYGLGSNFSGQVGCGTKKGDLSTPTLLETFKNDPAKYIHCSYRRSLAITRSGKVWIWGQAIDDIEAHQLNYELFLPKEINISNISSICSTKMNIYFLTNEGLIYFIGQYKDENQIDSYQFVPRLINNDTTIRSMHSVGIYQGKSVSTATDGKIVYILDSNQILETKCKTFFDFYLNEYKLTHNSIHLTEDFIKCFRETNVKTIEELKPIEKTNIDLKINAIQAISRFQNDFKNIKALGSGGFGTVFEAMKKSDQKLYAVKKVLFKSPIDIIKEINALSRIHNEMVVQYYDSWIEENNCLYIQLELCSDNLKNIIEEKPKFFKRQESEAMDSTEYFISCQIFKELLECVQYIHGLNPTIIHRDLKPANILITRDPLNHRFIKLGDFGLAVEVGIHTVYLSRGGTRDYMAPEVRTAGEGKAKFSPKADVYSLGVIAQELFDYDINSTYDTNQFNEELRTPLNELGKLILDMMNPGYIKRPTCANVLSTFNKWGIDGNQLKNSNDFKRSKLINENPDNFFIIYLKSKI